MFKLSSLPFLAALALPACVGGADTTDSLAQDLVRDACPDNVPASLAPAADQDLSFVLDASGTQDYTCQTTASGGYAWTLVAPDAQLYLPGNDQVSHGHHFAGPTWEWEDGSTIVGKKVAGATVDKSAIPWLLLVAISHGPIDGKMTEVTAVQRLETAAGLAPATGCDADHVGAAANIPYTARYFFYVTRDPSKGNNQRCGA